MQDDPHNGQNTVVIVFR